MRHSVIAGDEMNGANESRERGSDAGETTRLIVQHRSIIFGFIVSQTGNYANAEDIFQDVCVTICGKYSQFEPGTDFKAWAMRITRNRLANYYRASAVEKRRMVCLSEDVMESLAEHPVWFEKEKPFAADLAALRTCLDKLKGRNRLLFLRRYGDGLSCGAIAREIGWTGNSVYVALSRLRAALRNCMRDTLATGQGALVTGDGE